MHRPLHRLVMRPIVRPFASRPAAPLCRKKPPPLITGSRSFASFRQALPPPPPRHSISKRFYKSASFGIGLGAISYLCYQGIDPSSAWHYGPLRLVMAEAPMLQMTGGEPRNGVTATIAELQDDEGRVAMRAKSTEELVLAMFVYGLCMVPGLVNITPPIIQAAEALHLQMPLYWIIKRTVFRHFCGGETPDECVASMDRLAESGINCILDLSIEADLHMDDKKTEDQGYFPLLENRADVVLDMTKECLRTAAAASSSGAFVAVKVTAFAPPELLLRLNTVLLQLEQGFDAWQLGDGTIDSEGLRQMAEHVLPPPKSIEQQVRREALLVQVKTPLDHIQTAHFFDPQGPHRDIWWETHEEHPEMTPLTPEELAAYDRMVQRLERVCDFAHNNHVGIMVDAEQSYFQEAIDHVAVNLQAKYNRRDDRAHTPTVYNTCKSVALKTEKGTYINIRVI